MLKSNTVFLEDTEEGSSSESSVIDFGFKSLAERERSGRLKTEFAISESLKDRLDLFCVTEGVSRLQLLLGVFQTLIYRCCGQNDFAIGLRQGQSQGLVHLECRGRETFHNLLLRIKKARAVKGTAQVVLSMDSEGEGLHDLEVAFVKRDGKFYGIIDASEGVFFEKSVEDMRHHFLRTLEEVVQDPGKQLDAIEFLSDAEEELLYDRLPTGERVDYPENVLDLLSEVVGRVPDEAAIQEEGCCFTYRELDQASNRLARYLMEREIGPKDVVGVCSLHSFKLIVSVLAVIKMGATYLPLDPSNPKARLKGMIQDAGPKVLLIQDQQSDKFDGVKVERFLLDEEWEKVEGVAGEEVSTPLNSNDTAYIIYTSGSTGRPKGILVAYKSLPHLSLERTGFYPKKTRSLLAGSIGFDISPLMIFHTLMTGGTLYIPDDSKRVDGEALIRFMDDHQLNYMMCVPSFYAMLLEKGVPLPKPLEIISLVGEQIPHSLPEMHAKLAPHVRLYNEYGPCEVAVGSNYALIYNPKLKEISPITVGRPLPNTQVFLLAPSLLPVLPQMKGEICIGGIGVAQGYLNNEDLTHKKFVSITLPDQSQVRVYRTGDFGRYLTNGNLEFLGRIDHQVKIRGHRVELGEIESALRRHEQVDEVAVIFEKENQRLIAYYTTILGEDLPSELIKAYLERLLPAVMIPNCYMQLEKFPRTIIQKINRKALPKVSKSSCSSKKTYTKNTLKNTLTAIWKEVLKNEDISKNQNFFDLGGNSLLLATVQTKVKEAFGLLIPMVDFFGASTIEDLMKLLTKRLNPNPSGSNPQSRKGGQDAAKKAPR